MSKRLLLIITMLISLASFSARAEYRVFILKIEDTATHQSRTVQTTLDHFQYAEYYPVRATETVSIEQTWMCRNRSDISQDLEQKYCPNPHAAKAPAILAAPKA